MAQQRDQWKSRLGFLLAVVGSAIGLGNIWRFPFLAYRNGGGAFLIPYFVALISVGIPLMIVEQGVGHYLRGSAPLTFARIRRRWEYVGWWMVSAATFGVLIYYCVVLGWCTNYLAYSFSLGWGADTQSFFMKHFTGSLKGSFFFGEIHYPVLAGVAAIWFINWIIIHRGVSKGIELANIVMVPLLFLIMIVMIVWGLNLPGAMDGVRSYLTFDFSALKNVRIWGEAFGQIFFTLSLGFGIMIAYASYLPSRAEIKRNAFISCFTNCIFEVAAGFAIFSVLGFMAHKSGTSVKDVVAGGPGLAFVTYPQIINQLPFAKNIFGVLFFLTLITAGITSSISILEAFISSLIDKFGWSRKSSVTGVCALGFMLSLIFTTHLGVKWVDIVDYFLCHYGLILGGLLEVVLVGWILKAYKLRDHINNVGEGKIGSWWVYVVTYWIPLVLFVLIIGDVVSNLNSPHGGYSSHDLIMVGGGAILLTVIISIILTKLRWKRVVGSK